METQFLKRDAYYISTFSGRVATGEEWESIFQEALDYGETSGWQQWGGHNLVEVEKLVTWREVEV